MHKYDTVLKSLLQDWRNSLLEQITGAKIGRWLNVELPEVTQTRVDLLGQTAGGKRLIGFELQSSNDKLLPLRMAEYALRVYRQYQRFPEQYVLYVGNEKLRMLSQLEGPAFHCHYRIIDIRDIGEDTLLQSPYKGDHILAILAKHPDCAKSIRRILESLATLEGTTRKSAFQELFILAGLRRVGKELRTEVERMPILEDIMTHDVLGPTFRKGRKEGLQEGRQKGRKEAGMAILRRLIAKRFGVAPSKVDKRLLKLSVAELEDISLRVLDAKTIDELFVR